MSCTIYNLNVVFRAWIQLVAFIIYIPKSKVGEYYDPRWSCTIYILNVVVGRWNELVAFYERESGNHG